MSRKLSSVARRPRGGSAIFIFPPFTSFFATLQRSMCTSSLRKCGKQAMNERETTSEHRRILVVDDEAQITRVLRTTLSAQGYDVRAANDPEEPLRLFEEWSPDLIVTD